MQAPFSFDSLWNMFPVLIEVCLFIYTQSTSTPCYVTTCHGQCLAFRFPVTSADPRMSCREELVSRSAFKLLLFRVFVSRIMFVESATIVQIKIKGIVLCAPPRRSDWGSTGVPDCFGVALWQRNDYLTEGYFYFNYRQHQAGTVGQD